MNHDSNAMTPTSVVAAPPGPDVNAMSVQASAGGGLADQIARLNPPQRLAAARQAEILSVIGQGLAGRPYGERRAVLAHMAPQLAARGVPPAAIAAFDPSDTNLAAALAEAGALRALLSPPAAAAGSPPGARPRSGRGRPAA
jgi:hypothetical protein